MARDLLTPAQPLMWHSLVTNELRADILCKILQAIFPLPMSELDHTAQRLQILTDYAKWAESYAFALANTQSEYYHLLAEKVFKVMREMEEKRQKNKSTSTSDSSNAEEVQESVFDFSPPDQEYLWKRLEEERNKHNDGSGQDNMIKVFQKHNMSP